MVDLRHILGAVIAVSGCTSTLPMSTSTTAVPKADTALSIHQSTFHLDGMLLSGTLQVGLDQWVQEHTSEFNGKLLIRVDGSEPITALREAVVTAKDVGFHTAWLVVVGPSGDEQAIQLSLQPPKQDTQTARAAESAPTVKTHWANPRLIISSEKGLILSAFDNVYEHPAHSTQPLVLPCGPTGHEPCTVETFPFLEATRLARRLKLDHPGDRAFVIQTTPDIQVQSFVSGLDAMRDDANSGRRRMEMFPEPIFDYTDPKP